MGGGQMRITRRVQLGPKRWVDLDVGRRPWPDLEPGPAAGWEMALSGEEARTVGEALLETADEITPAEDAGPPWRTIYDCAGIARLPQDWPLVTHIDRAARTRTVTREREGYLRDAGGVDARRPTVEELDVLGVPCGEPPPPAACGGCGPEGEGGTIDRPGSGHWCANCGEPTDIVEHKRCENCGAAAPTLYHDPHTFLEDDPDYRKRRVVEVRWLNDDHWGVRLEGEVSTLAVPRGRRTAVRPAAGAMARLYPLSGAPRLLRGLVIGGRVYFYRAPAKRCPRCLWARLKGGGMRCPECGWRMPTVTR